GQNDVGEYRARLEIEKLVAGLVFLNDVGADDIGRHQIRCELNSRRTQVQRITESLHELRLSQSRHAFQQNVPLAQDGHENVVNDVGISDNHLRDLVMHSAELS